MRLEEQIVEQVVVQVVIQVYLLDVRRFNRRFRLLSIERDVFVETVLVLCSGCRIARCSGCRIARL
jgi:hypothetical protein